MRLSLAFTGLAMAACAPALAQEGINWLDNYQAALQEARRTQKPIFLEFRCEA